ncbi:MAG: precorrin-8X methylmutase [Desulfocapsaceae bacterium]|nr:precorrin-8X methylmutase [Desulfocapsaceae bacterium]
MVTLQQIKPLEIEAESFRIIEREFAGETGSQIEDYSREEFAVMRRVIHATGDFGFAANLRFHKQAIAAGLAAIRAGKNVLTDVNMAAAGISRSYLGKFGGQVICRVGEVEVAERASRLGLTRSETAMAMAAEDNVGIVAIGNAPTALLALMELIEAGIISPDLVVGVPVGFVNAAESKEILSQKNYPFITALGRKGGSPVAVAIVNALLRMA